LMRAILRLRAVVTLGAGLMMLAGCASQPSRFYLLSALPSTQAAATIPGKGPAIGVGPVTLPKYLDRPQIVTRAGPYQLYFGEYDRWAESLDTNFSRALAENLSLLTPTDQVFLYPWPRGTPITYQVSIEVAHFLGQLGGESLLIANWTLFRGEGQETLISRKSRYSTPTTGEAYEAMVAAMSQTVADISRDIATAIQGLGPMATALNTPPSPRPIAYTGH
jgi:uncharacterized lipoprotein YmbA